MSGTNSILFVDAYDSFSNNIVALLYSCVSSADIVVVRIDTDIENEFHVDVETFLRGFRAIVLGPGPGHPANKNDIGLFEDVWRVAEQRHIPVLGICLGFQSLCVRNGYSITRMHMPCHGHSKPIRTGNLDIFEDLEDVCAMNYNSLAVQKTEFVTDDENSRPGSSGTDTTTSSGLSDFASIDSYTGTRPGKLQLLAWDDDGYVMGVRHALLPFWGFQFHPESCMSQGCVELVRKWWSKADQYNEIHQPEEHPEQGFISRKISKPVAIPQPEESTSNGQVSWRMLKVKNLTAAHISDLCYESNKNGVTAMLESTAKGNFSIYPFVDAESELITYSQGCLISSSTKQPATRHRTSQNEALKYLERRTKASACIGGCPKVPFWGGLIGYLSYEMGLDMIKVASPEPRNVPDFNFVFVDRSVVFDSRTNDICIQSIRPSDEAWIDDIESTIQKLDSDVAKAAFCANQTDLSDILRSAKFCLPEHKTYTSLIRQCQDKLHAGESYELCLTAEATIDLPDPIPDTSYNLYKNLRKTNPVPYASYLHFPSQSGNPDQRNMGTTIFSSSPELFLSQSRIGTMDMIPMKGTVQRTPTTNFEDVVRILHNPKETAENLMIADLIRHDLYAVVGTKPYPLFAPSPNPTIKPQYSPQKTIQPPAHEDDQHKPLPPSSNTNDQTPTRDALSIPALNTIKEYETVYQLTSHIRAHPPPHLSHNNPKSVITHNHRALHHVLPPGSMTGAPKKRSCEILRTLERRNRGVYSGVIGYMDVGGGAAWSVAIRTAWSGEDGGYTVPRSAGREGEDGESQDIQVEKRRIWRVGAGGAVTVLSEVEGEWEEMMGKLGNVLKGFRA